jgi:hypothetical protein
MAEPLPWDPWPRESTRAHARFRHFAEQGPGRQLNRTAAHFGVKLPTISEQAKRCQWLERARAWDQAHASAAPSPAPQRLHLAAASSALPPPATEGERVAEAEYQELLEQYRSAVEALGREQLVTARAMTATAKRTAMRLLREERVLGPRDLPAFVNSMVNLASSSQAAWAKALGVEKLLRLMEQSLAEANDLETPS